jgi:FkbM family methyltransferase
MDNSIELYIHNTKYKFNIEDNNHILGGAKGLKESMTTHNWEQNTFDVFDFVKNKNKNAIDIGAWVGLTTVWLSNNFNKVLAIEADSAALKALKSNLKHSECNNVEIIDRPIYNKNESIIFGTNQYDATYSKEPLGSSTSQIKDGGFNENDYTVNSITLSDINKMFPFEDVGFIKVDIEAGEQYIIKELVKYAEIYNLELFISFHLQWWKHDNILEIINTYEDLFKNTLAIMSIDLNRQLSVSEFKNYLLSGGGSDSFYLKF